MGGRGADPLRVLCTSPDGTVATGVAAMLASMPDFVFATRTTRYGEAAGSTTDLDLAFVVLGGSPGPGLDVLERLRREAPDAFLVVIAGDDDPELFVQAVRAGAHDHLTLPLSQHDLFKICTKVTARAYESARGERGGALWVVYGAKGGVGATTIAVNLCVALAASRRQPALVDLDVYTGDAAFFLNVQPAATLRDLVANQARLDGVFVRGVMTRHPAGVAILAAPSLERGQPPVEPTADVALRILELVTAMHDVTVVNTHGIPSETTRAVLLAADRILLVTDVTIPALRASAGTIEWLVGEGVETNEVVDVIVNRHDPRAAEIAVAEVARRMQAPVRAVLPNDVEASRAANAGRPIAEGTALHRAVAELAGPGATRTESGLLKRSLARLFSGRAA